VIVDKLKFYTGLGMLGVFVALLGAMFSPIFDGKNGLEQYNPASFQQLIGIFQEYKEQI